VQEAELAEQWLATLQLAQVAVNRSIAQAFRA
jgi:hypothetical protein